MNDESEEKKYTPLEIDAITAKTKREILREWQKPIHTMQWGWYWETPNTIRIYSQVIVRDVLVEYGKAWSEETALALLPRLKQQMAEKLNCSVEQIKEWGGNEEKP